MDSSPLPENTDFQNSKEDDIDVDDDVGETEEDVGNPCPNPVNATLSGNKRKGFPVSVKKKKKVASVSTRSSVWEKYTRTKENRNKCKCNYCGKMMSCATTSGTSNLKKHLTICKEYIAWQQSRSQSQHIITPEGEGGLMRLAKVSEDVFREAANEMLVMGELPLAFIDGLAFKHFCTRCNLYRPHSRRTATREIVKMFVERKAAMRKILNAANQRVSLTTDIWVAPTTAASYMVITAHFIDTSWQMRKLIIGFKNVSDHKGSTISSVLLECIDDWGIKKLFTITVDNATANTNALKRLRDELQARGSNALVLGGEHMHMRCCAHILNLIVKDGLHEVHDSVAAIRNAVQYVRSSSTRGKSFALRVETGKVKRGSLSLDCQTRWNSTYLMLTRALKFRVAFDKMEAEDKLYNDYFLGKEKDGKKRIGPPTTTDWDAIDRLVKFLVIFYHSTLTVSASAAVSAHKCYNEIVIVERNLILLSNEPDEKTREKAEAMREKFDKYWDGMSEINPLLIVACILDPRNKMKFPMLCFERLYGKDSPQSKALNDNVMDVLKKLFDEYNEAAGAKVGTSGTSTQSGADTSNASGGFESQDNCGDDLGDRMELDSDEEEGYERMDTIYQEMVNEIGFQDASNEVELYLKEKVENPKILKGTEYDVLSWWRMNSQKFPVLSEIARDVLAMQVSSVASESAFSTSGRILDPSRSCLTHYMIEVLMCTEQWLKCQYQLNEKGVVTIQQMLSFIELQDKLEKDHADES